MTRDELLTRLRECVADAGDPERAHSVADDALLEFINDAEIDAAYNAVTRWYA